MIKAACLLGVLAGGGTQKQLLSAAEFAHNLGLAFQIRDDMLDVIGDAKDLGKATGADSEKNTFVQLYGIETCDRLVQEHTDKAIQALSAFKDCDYMKSLAYSLVNRYH